MNPETPRPRRAILRVLQDLCALAVAALGGLLLWLAFRMKQMVPEAQVAVAWLLGFAVLSLVWSAAVLIANHFVWKGSEEARTASRFITIAGLGLSLFGGPFLGAGLPWLFVVLVPVGVPNVIVGLLLLFSKD